MVDIWTRISSKLNRYVYLHFLVPESAFTDLLRRMVNWFFYHRPFQLSVEKTKSKLLQRSTRRRENGLKCQRELKIKTSKALKARENKSWLVLFSHLIGWESGASFLNQSQSRVKQNQWITFDAHLKIVLFAQEIGSELAGNEVLAVWSGTEHLLALLFCVNFLNIKFFFVKYWF